MFMSSRIVMSTAVAFGCAVVLQAQTPTASQANRTIPGEVTLTGCVERADQVAQVDEARGVPVLDLLVGDECAAIVPVRVGLLVDALPLFGLEQRRPRIDRETGWPL